MAARKGNKYWELREKSGRDKILTPKELFLLAFDYIEDVDKNPVEIEDNKGTKNINKIKLNRPYNWAAFQVFVFKKTGLVKLEDYKRAEGSYHEFSDVIHIIENIFFANKFEGASIGIFKENIIARDLGLKDTTQTEHSGEIKTSTITALNKEEQDKITSLLNKFKDESN